MLKILKQNLQKLGLIINLFLGFCVCNNGGLIAQNVFNMRFGLGYYEEFMDINPRLYLKVDDVANPYVDVRPYKFGKGTTWLLLKGEVEYIKNQKFSIGLGYLFNMGVSTGLSYNYKSISKTDNSKIDQNGRSLVNDAEYIKIPLQFQYKVYETKFNKKYENSGRVSIWPTFGMSFLRFYWGNNEKAYSYHSYPSSYFNFEAVDGNNVTIEEKYYLFSMNNASVFGGINFKFHNKQSEIFSFAIIYEHVILPATRLELRVFTPNKIYYYDTYGKGNNLSFKLSFPVFSYNFTKKKFYRD